MGVLLETVERLSSYSKGLYGQILMNGNFDIWQRGTTFAKTTSGWMNTADRWGIYPQDGSSWSITASRQLASLNGSLYCMRFQRTAGNTSTGRIRLAQAVETINSIPLRGQKLTLSFYARCGANYSPGSSGLSVYLVTGTGTDENLRNGFTGEATILDDAAYLTTSWQKFTFVVDAALADTITQLGLRFNMYPVGTAGANDWFEITQVHLNVGTEELPFSPKGYSEELRDCQRYCYVIDVPSTAYVASGMIRSTGTMQCPFQLPEVLRIVPTITATNMANWGIRDGSATHTVTSWGGIRLSGASVDVQVGSGSLTIGAGAVLYGSTGEKLVFEAEM